jgi:hypothetical protein
MKTLLRQVFWAGVLMVAAVGPAVAQQTPAAQLLDQTVAAMGGRDKLLGVSTLVYTGFGQDAYMDGGGNITAEPNVPPKWRAIADAQRSIDLKTGRALLQQRRAPMFPFAAPFGLNWNRTSTTQAGAELLDHPLPAVLAALDPAARLTGVRVDIRGETQPLDGPDDTTDYEEGEWVTNAESGAMEWHAADGTVLTQDQWNVQAAEASAAPAAADEAAEEVVAEATSEEVVADEAAEEVVADDATEEVVADEAAESTKEGGDDA